MTTYLGNPHDSKIFQEIADERDRQDEKWGDQSGNTNFVWSTVLMEEVGEAAQEVLDGAAIKSHDMGHFWCKRCGMDQFSDNWNPDICLADKDKELRKELIQVIAVGVAWVEALDKKR